jgi:hypothetical protein
MINHAKDIVCPPPKHTTVIYIYNNNELNTDV